MENIEKSERTSFEHHHGDWASGKHVSDDQLGDDVQSNLLIGNGLDHTNGNGVDKGDDQSDDKCPDGELSGPYFDGDDTKDEHTQEDNHVPPFGDLRVLGHQASMDIRLFADRATGLHPYLLAEVEEGVCKRSGDRSKRKTVRDGESRRQEEGTIGFVSLFVKRRISVNNS